MIYLHIGRCVEVKTAEHHERCFSMFSAKSSLMATDVEKRICHEVSSNDRIIKTPKLI